MAYIKVVIFGSKLLKLAHGFVGVSLLSSSAGFKNVIQVTKCFVYALHCSEAMPKCKQQSGRMHAVRRRRSDVARQKRRGACKTKVRRERQL